MQRQDILGLYEGVAPKFVKQFADIKTAMLDAFRHYKEEVVDCTFPGEAQGFKIAPEIMSFIKEDN